MPVPASKKFVVGALDEAAEAAQRGDPEALEYYNVPTWHYASRKWDELDMSKVDVGIHSDPSEAGIQAKDRRDFLRVMGEDRGGEMKRFRINIGNSLHVRDVGGWDSPDVAARGIYDALEDVDRELADEFLSRFLGGRWNAEPNWDLSTKTGSAKAIRSMDDMRSWLLSKDIDTIEYINETEGREVLGDAAVYDPEYLSWEAEQLEKIKDRRDRAAQAYRDGDGDLGLDLENEAAEIETDLDISREELRERAEQENVSYISLDPGRVRDAQAAFSKDAIGKPGMMLGAGGLGVIMAGKPDSAEAAPRPRRGLLDENMVTAEVIPSIQTDAGKAILGQPLDVREEYSRGVFDILKNDPMLRGANATPGYGAYQGNVNPNYIFRTNTPEEAKAVADIVGGATMQDATPYVTRRGDPDGPIGFNIRGSRDFVPDDLLRLLNESGIDSTRSMPRELDAIRFEDDLSESEFSERLRSQFPDSQMTPYRAGGDYNVTEGEWLNPKLDPLRDKVKSFNDRFLERLSSGAKAVIPGATAAAFAGMSPTDVYAGVLDTANRAGETVVNDVLSGGQMVSNAMYDTDYEAPQVQFAPRTEPGNRIISGALDDVGEFIQGTPFGRDVMRYAGYAGDAWDAIEPYIGDRTALALGGTALVGGTIAMPTGAKGAKELISRGIDNLGTAPGPIRSKLGAVGPDLGGFGPVDRSSRHLQRVGDVDSVNNMRLDVEGDGVQEPPLADPQELIGRPYVSSMADVSTGDNRVITNIEGVPVEVRRQGGNHYMEQPKNLRDGRIWASADGAVTGIMNAAAQASKLPGAEGPPLLLPWGMSPRGSSDFGQFSADLAVQHARGALPDHAKREIDRRIRAGAGDGNGQLAPFQEWVGIDDASPDYLSLIGGARNRVLKALDEYRGDGALNLSQVRTAVGDRDVVDHYRPGQIWRVGQIDLDRGVLSDSNHNTYNRGVPGTVIGRLNPGASVLDDPGAMLRKGTNLRQKYGEIGDKIPTHVGKAMQSNVIGVLSEDVIDRWYRAGVFGDR